AHADRQANQGRGQAQYHAQKHPRGVTPRLAAHNKTNEAAQEREANDHGQEEDEHPWSLPYSYLYEPLPAPVGHHPVAPVIRQAEIAVFSRTARLSFRRPPR